MWQGWIGYLGLAVIIVVVGWALALLYFSAPPVLKDTVTTEAG